MPKPSDPSSPSSPPSPSSPRPPDRLAQLRRLETLKTLLRGGWKTHQELMERCGCSRATLFRDLTLLGEQEALERDEKEGRVSYRLPARQETIRLTTSQMVALQLALNAMSFLAGTGIREDLDEVTAQISHVLSKGDYAHWKSLDRKLYDMNEMAYDYSEKLDVVNEVMSAVLEQQRVACTFRPNRVVTLDPYAIVLYKKGLYVVGYSHTHGSILKFGLDKMDDADRIVDAPFEYPADFSVKAYLDGPFGMIRGPRTAVTMVFEPEVAYFATRRKVHPTQRHREIDEPAASTRPGKQGKRVEFRLEPEGTEEMIPWVLGFGAKAEVREPKWLREKIVAELKAALARYES